MPTVADVDAEARLLAALTTHGDIAARYLAVSGFEPGWFAHPDHRRVAAQLAAGTPTTDLPGTVRAAATDLPVLAGEVRRLTAALNAAAEGQVEPGRLLAAVPAHQATFDAYDHREVLTGQVDNLQRDADGAPQWPLARCAIAPTPRAYLAGAAAGAAGLAGTAHAVGALSAGQAVAVGAAAAVTVLFAIVVATLDWWTMWVDVAAVKVWTATLAAVAAVAAVVGVSLFALIPALAAGAVVALFEVGGWWLRRRRGVEAHGAGDSLVIPLVLYPPLLGGWLATPAGVPASWAAATVVQQATWTLLVACLTATVLAAVARPPETAFGEVRVPFLPAWVLAPTIGWVAAGWWL